LVEKLAFYDSHILCASPIVLNVSFLLSLVLPTEMLFFRENQEIITVPVLFPPLIVSYPPLIDFPLSMVSID
jgi:hypothetical protein